MGHLIRVLVHNFHQFLHWPAVAASPHFIERHHYEETEGPGRVSRNLLLDVPDSAPGFSSHGAHLFHEAPGPMWGPSALDDCYHHSEVSVGLLVFFLGGAQIPMEQNLPRSQVIILFFSLVPSFPEALRTMPWPPLKPLGLSLT